MLESPGTFFSTITKLFTHSVTSLTSFKIPSCSKFLISLWNASWRWTGTHLGACLAGFAFGFSWNLYGGPGNFPIPVNMSEYNSKDVLLLQWHALKLLFIDRPLSGMNAYPHRFLHFPKDVMKYHASWAGPGQL